MSTAVYQPLEVIETFTRSDGRRWWVRDDEIAHLWNLVEYVDRRLECGCDDGQAHTESPDTEAPCAHLSAVVDLRMAENQSSRTHGVIRPAAFVD